MEPPWKGTEQEGLSELNGKTFASGGRRGGTGKTMKLTYDPKVDALYVRFADKPTQGTTQRLTEDIAVNYGPKGDIVGIEILDARHYLKFVGARPKIEAENLVVS